MCTRSLAFTVFYDKLPTKNLAFLDPNKILLRIVINLKILILNLLIEAAKVVKRLKKNLELE